ncbi:MAG: 30S ribosomal protein S5 [Candidatus Micrarchaeota archaeon]|nr:MAG: 30S ribosomal protein S5 [Candidatus Micrarchaeota archaeon]
MNDQESVKAKEFNPKTSLGKAVKNGEIKSIDQIFEKGLKIKEPEIVDILLPNLKSEVIDTLNVQRVTKNGRKAKYRVISIVGDMNGHVGIGVGKNVELKAAIDESIVDAKKHIMAIPIGCGSWECGCGTAHSIPVAATGKCGHTEVKIAPAPRGIGLVAGEEIRKLMYYAGVKDIWTFSRGTTKSSYNVLMAAKDALSKIANMKSTDRL